MFSIVCLVVIVLEDMTMILCLVLLYLVMKCVIGSRRWAEAC